MNCWHYSHAKGNVVKSINFLSCMVSYDDFSMPIGYEIIKPVVGENDRKLAVPRATQMIFKCLLGF